MRMGTKKEKFLVLMKVLSIEIPVKEPVSRMTIEWKRGDKKSETKTPFAITPEQPVAYVNETFSKASVFYRSTKTDKYFKKLVHIRARGFTQSGGAKEKILGELELDLSLFVNSAGDTKTLLLSKALPNSRIQLQISVQRDDGAAALVGRAGSNYIDSSSDEEQQRETASASEHTEEQKRRQEASQSVYVSSALNGGGLYADLRDPDKTQRFSGLDVQALLKDNEQHRWRVKDLENEVDDLKRQLDFKERSQESFKQATQQKRKFGSLTL